MTLNANGLGAISQQMGVANFAAGYYTGDGSGSININIGFTPRKVRVFNSTDVVDWEWSEFFPATVTKKVVTGGTMTADTGSAIVANVNLITVTEVAVGTPGAQGPGEGTQGTVVITEDSPNLNLPALVFSTALNVTGKVYAWEAIA